MKTIIIGAGSDLGVHIDGAHLGPTQLLNDIESFYKGEKVSLIQEDVEKSRNLSDRRKNEYEIDKFNTDLYDLISSKIKEDYFPIVIGGDQSICVSSTLASANVHGNIGLIWFDANTDYNTFDSTVTGNIADLSLATITGYKNQELRYFHKGNVIQPIKTVMVGVRDIKDWEKDNVKYSGINVISATDIEQKGLSVAVDEAFKIAGEKTDGVYICFDLGLIDPQVSPGVSVPTFDGLSEDEVMQIIDIVAKNINKVIGFDLVEFNPLRDENRKTEQIAVNIIAKIIGAVKNKRKFN